MTGKLNVVLAAGGTGGHIFPAESLAVELIKSGHKVTLITDKRYQKRAYTPEKMEIRTIQSASTSGGFAAKINAIMAIAIGFAQARKHIKILQADVVVGFGGYPSFPTMLAAVSLRKKTIIHEQNALMGKVNRILAPFTKLIATSFTNTQGIRKSDLAKVVLTGNPVRPAIKAIKDFPYSGIDDDGHLHILVVGGSQGTSFFSDVVPQAIMLLPENIRTKIRLDQQCRKEDLAKVKGIYDKGGINAELAPFFEDVPARLASSHIVIARAGASTLAELMVAGRPSILIPYMYAAEDHQMVNALALEKFGGAIVFSQKILTPEMLNKSILRLAENQDLLKKMAVNAFELGVPDAAERLAKLVVK